MFKMLSNNFLMVKEPLGNFRKDLGTKWYFRNFGGSKNNFEKVLGSKHKYRKVLS